MSQLQQEIEEIVNREKDAWEMKDAELLLTVFHEDMVWAWPRNFDTLNPFYWQVDLGRFNHASWKVHWQDFFDAYELVDALVKVQKVQFSDAKDAAFAVVDLNVQWEDKMTGRLLYWRGRVCKVYTKVRDNWKLLSHTGFIPYKNL